MDVPIRINALSTTFQTGGKDRKIKVSQIETVLYSFGKEEVCKQKQFLILRKYDR